jgi:uncharacterized membrane protein
MGKVETSIEIDAPLREVYNQWTQFEEFPLFMDGVKEVRQKDDTHLHWTAEVGGKTHEWDAEITEQKPDERVAWQATDGKTNAGVVTFHRLDDMRSKVMVQMDWDDEGLLETLGSALGSDERKVKSDLERFRDLVESRGAATGGWRGKVEQGEVTGRRS